MLHCTRHACVESHAVNVSIRWLQQAGRCASLVTAVLHPCFRMVAHGSQPCTRLTGVHNTDRARGYLPGGEGPQAAVQEHAATL
jgi:hypothetical protein